MRWQEYVHRSPELLGGKPVFIGTRISIELVLEELAAGDSYEAIAIAYPSITTNHIRAAFAYAAASLRSDEIVFLHPDAPS